MPNLFRSLQTSAEKFPANPPVGKGERKLANCSASFPARQTQFQAETLKPALSILYEGHPVTSCGNVLPSSRKNNLPGNRTSIKSHRGKAPLFPRVWTSKEVCLPLTWNSYQRAQVIKNAKAKGKTWWVIGHIGCNAGRFPPDCHLRSVDSNLQLAKSTRVLSEQAFCPRFRKTNPQPDGKPLLLRPLSS